MLCAVACKLFPFLWSGENCMTSDFLNIPHLSCYQVELEKSQTIQDLKSLNIIFVTLESNAST